MRSPIISQIYTCYIYLLRRYLRDIGDNLDKGYNDDISKRTRFMSKVDCKSAFWLVPMASEDQCKTAFITRQGLYEFTVMPFGLTNAPATLQRLMNELLKDLIGVSCCIYLDDCLVCSETFEDHVRDLRQVLLRYRAAGLKANPKKSELGLTEVLFLGHVVDQHGIRPNPEKISAVQKFLPPTNITEVRSFLGLVNYYRRFIPDMARIALPIQNLTRKDVTFIWTDACEAAFRRLKELLTSAPLLRRPDFDHPFLLQTDWQPTGMGAILSQKIDNVEHVIAYASKSLKIQEQHYAPTEGELLACMWAIRHFHCHLHGHPFVLETDHKALTYLLTSKNLSTKLTRYAMELQEYDFEMRHRPGHLHTNVDALSRLISVPPDDAPCIYTVLPYDEEPYLPEPIARLRKTKSPALLPKVPTSMHKRGTEHPSQSPILPIFSVPTTPHKRGTHAPTGDITLCSAGQGIDEADTDPPSNDITTNKITRPEFSMPSIYTALFPSSEAPVDLTGGESDPDCDKVIYLSSPPKGTNDEKEITPKEEHATELATELAPPEEDDGPPINPNTVCSTCGSPDYPDTMLICEGCQEGYHLDCLEPPLDTIPEGHWYCLSCDALGERHDLPRVSTLDITLDLDVLRFMETGKLDLSWTLKQKQRVYRRAKNYTLRDGHLYFRPNAKYHWPRKVPNIEDRTKLIEACHDDLGHFGMVRTCYILQDRFFWSNMTHDVRDFINNCPTCATKKASFLLPDKLHSFPISARFDRVHIDLMGPFPESSSGNKYVVCCIDAFTKWPEAAAIPNKEACTVANFFLTNIISRHGAPQTVVSDNGREFDGEFAKLLEDCYIEHRHSSPNHPQTNGLVERFNQTLHQALLKSVKGQSDWDQHLNKVLFGYRIGMQATTKYSPFELLYGRPAVIPIQNSCRPKDHIKTEDDNYNPDARSRDLIKKTAPFHDLYESAYVNMQRAQHRQQEDFKKRHITSNRKAAATDTDLEWEGLLYGKKHRSELASHMTARVNTAAKLPATPQKDKEPFAPAAFRASTSTGCPWEGCKGSCRPNQRTTLKEGDFVMVKNPHKKSKLDAALIGPYRFMKFTDNTCAVALLQTRSGKGWKESSSHISPLRKDGESTSLSAL